MGDKEIQSIQWYITNHLACKELEKQIEAMQWQINYMTYVADNYPTIDGEACGYADGVE